MKLSLIHIFPTYMLIKNLGMLDSIWALVVPTSISVWNLIITRTYFQSTIPGEVQESASVDGCDDFTFLIKIAIPLAKPILAVNAVSYTHLDVYKRQEHGLKKAVKAPDWDDDFYPGKKSGQQITDRGGRQSRQDVFVTLFYRSVQCLYRFHRQFVLTVFV